MKGRILLRILTSEPLNYRIIRTKGSHMTLQSNKRRRTRGGSRVVNNQVALTPIRIYFSGNRDLWVSTKLIDESGIIISFSDYGSVEKIVECIKNILDGNFNNKKRSYDFEFYKEIGESEEPIKITEFDQIPSALREIAGINL